MNEDDIKQILRERGLTQDQVCKLGNFSRMTMHRILKGSRPMSILELLGLKSLPKTPGPKPKVKK